MPEIFQYDFMIRATIAAVLIGATAPAFGVFLVLRRLSLIADTLAHVALLGVAIALLTRAFAPLVGLAATTTAAVSIEELRSRRLLPGDAALAVFLYGALAISVVIISLADGFNVDLFSFLFGSVLTVSGTDLWYVLGVMIAVWLFLFIFHSELAQTSFDTALARVNGVRVHTVSVALAVMTAATITVSMQVVGVLLVGALIVIPVMVSLRVASGIGTAVLVASLTGLVVSFLGMVIAFYADIAPGGSVVLTAVGALLLVETGAIILRRRRRGTLPAAPTPAPSPTSHAHATERDPEQLDEQTISHR